MSGRERIRGSPDAAVGRWLPQDDAGCRVGEVSSSPPSDTFVAPQSRLRGSPESGATAFMVICDLELGREGFPVVAYQDPLDVNLVWCDDPAGQNGAFEVASW